MLWLGLLSIVQIIWLPGYIFLQYINPQGYSRMQKLIYGFAISLFINYVMVYYLTLIGMFRRDTLVAVFIVEAALLLRLVMRSRNKTRNPFNAVRITANETISFKLLSFISWIVIAYYGVFLWLNLGTILNAWDIIFSYNRWALDWYHNSWPAFTYHYPQLMPANWALIYLITGQPDIQFFTKAIMPLFPLATLFIFYDLAVRRQKTVYLGALIIFGFILRYYSDPFFITNAYVDIAVAFCGILAWSQVLNIQHKEKNIFDYFLLALFASTAAATKQPGIYILIVVLVVTVYLVCRDKFSGSQKVRIGIIYAAVIFFGILTMYIFKQADINTGLDNSEILPITRDVHGGRDYTTRMVYSFNLLTNGSQTPALGEKGSKISFGIISLLLIAGLFVPESRSILLALVIPYSLIWALFLSYSIRNLNFVYPFVAFASAHGGSFLYRIIRHWFTFNLPDKWRRVILFMLKIIASVVVILFVNPYFAPADKANSHITAVVIGILIVLHFIDPLTKNIRRLIRWNWLMILLIAMILVGAYFFPAEYFYQNQQEKLWRLGNPIVNELLYQFRQEHSLEGEILTDYWWLTVLPGLTNDNQKVCPYSPTIDEEVQSLRNPRITVVNFPAPIEKNIKAETTYLLLSDSYGNDPVTIQFLKKVNNEQIFRANGYRFIKIKEKT